jgi:large subunit ribosomal protein L32e
MAKKFLRRIWTKYSKLGRGRKKKQKWKKPKGRDNKMREKRRGYPKTVNIGYGNSKKMMEKTKIIRNIKDLENISPKSAIIIGNIGKKKKLEIIRKAQEKNMVIKNVNAKKFLKKNKLKEKKKEEIKEKKHEIKPKEEKK